MKKINLVITGCMGRMGQQIIKSVKKDKDFKLVALTENKKISKMINGIRINLNTEEAFRKAHLIIDFTTPKCTFQVLKIASKLKKRVVIGTTGFTKNEEKLIKKFSKKIPILKASSVFKLTLIPLIILFIFLFSVRATNLKFLSFLTDLIIC